MLGDFVYVDGDTQDNDDADNDNDELENCTCTCILHPMSNFRNATADVDVRPISKNNCEVSDSVVRKRHVSDSSHNVEYDIGSQCSQPHERD